MATEILERIRGVSTHSHKDMGGLVINAGDLRESLKNQGCRMDADPSTQGGLIWLNGKPVAYLRSPFWREEKNDPTLREKDIKPLFIMPEQTLLLDSTETGGEFEMFVWNPQVGEMAPVMAPNSSFKKWLEEHGNGNGFEVKDAIFPNLDENARKIGFSAELIEGCIELNFHHSSNTEETALSMARGLRKVAQAAEAHGLLLTPIAAYPHRELRAEDTNQDSYIQRIAMDYMGWENVRHFIGSSWQVHVEMIDLKSSLKAINLYQQVSPLMYGLSLAGPFAHGQTDPNLKDIYLEDEKNEARLGDSETYHALDSNDWLSIRLPARWRGSPSGGVFTEPAPENPQEFFAKAEAGLRDNQAESSANIPSPARTMGNHRDRIRIDIKDHGTLEISNQDTYGGHVPKLAANQEFTRVLIWKLQVLAREGRLNEMAQAYPTLFSYPVTQDSLRQTHLASIEIAKHGMDSEIKGADGKVYPARGLFYQLMNFVNEPLAVPSEGIDYQGLPQGINRELYNSSLNPEDVFASYTDSQGITSSKGFYERGVGTLSHWLKRRAEELMSQGLTSQEVIKDCMNDLGKSYHEHLAKINGSDIAKLFS